MKRILTAAALADTLKRAQWGQMEIDIITRALAACGLDR